MDNSRNILQLADSKNPSSHASPEWIRVVERSIKKSKARRAVFKHALVVMVVVVALFGSTTSFAQNTHPSSPLYPVKLVSENILVRVVPNDRKAFVTRHLIDRRIEELKQSPESLELIRTNLDDLLRLQEHIIINEPLGRAIPDTMSLVLMFQRDIERLQTIEQTREVALAIATLNQRLLDSVTPASTLPLFENQTHDLNQEILFIFPTSIPTPTPTNLQPAVSQYFDFQDSLRSSRLQTTQDLLRFLRAKNSLHIQTISPS